MVLRNLWVLPVLFLVLLLPGLARAETAESFLKGMSGTWRGSGTMHVSEKSKKSPVRCKITSTFDAKAHVLRNKGRCATAQRKAIVSGSIRFSPGSNALSGSYIRSFGDLAMTKSSGAVGGGKLVLNSTFIEKGSNRLIRTKSVIKRLSARKFVVTIFEKINGRFQWRGKVVLSR